MKEIMDANLNAKASENIKEAKKPDMVLLIWSWLNVRRNGLLTMVIVISEPCKWFMYVSAAKFCKKNALVGIFVFTMEVKG